MAGVNDLLNDLDRKIYEIEQLLTAEYGPTNVFQDIVLDPGGGGPVVTVSPIASPPTGLVIVPGTFFDRSYADMTWTTPADGSATSYEIEWAKRDGTGPYTYELINATRVHGNSYRIEDLEPGQWYGARIYSLNRVDQPSVYVPATGFQDFLAATDANAPAAPTGLIVTAAFKSIVARWNDNAEADMAMGKGVYRVQLATDAAFTNIIRTTNVSGTLETWSDLTVNTTYYVRVYAIDSSSNQSAPSTVVSATTGQIVSDDLHDAAVLATKIAVGSTNLLMDSSFEGTTLSRYWVPVGGWARNTTGPMHGTAMASYSTTHTGATWDALSQTINILPASPITVTFLYQMNSKMQQAHFKIDYYDAVNNFISSWQPLGGTNGPVAQTRVTVSSTAPSNAVKAVASAMGGWSVDGTTATYDVDGIYIVATAVLPSGVTWAPATNEIMPAMVFGDMIVANAIQVWNMAANSVGANQVIANSIASGHISTLGLDAGTIKFGTLDGNLATIVNISAGGIKTSTLTTATITLNGGSLQAGSPPTTGLLLNSQGLRLYSGGVAQVTLDVGGTASFTGAIMATSGTLQTLAVTGWLTASGGGFQTASSGQRVAIGGGGFEVSFYTGSSLETNRGFINVGNAGSLTMTSPTINNGGVFSQSKIDLSNNQMTFSSYNGIRMLLRDAGNNLLGNGYNGYFTVGDPNWYIGVLSPRPGTGGSTIASLLGYYGDGTTGANQIAGIFDNHSVTYPCYASGDGVFHYATSSRKLKVNIRKLDHRKESSLEKLNKLSPVRYQHKHAKKSERTNRISLVAEEVLDTFPEGAWPEIDESLPANLDLQSLIGLIVHSVQELQETTIKNLEDEVATLKERVAVLAA